MGVDRVTAACCVHVDVCTAHMHAHTRLSPLPPCLPHTHAHTHAQFCATNFTKCYPRYDHKEIPPFEKRSATHSCHHDTPLAGVLTLPSSSPSPSSLSPPPLLLPLPSSFSPPPSPLHPLCAFSLMDEYGRSLEGSNVKYNPENCVLEKEVVSLKQYVSPIDKDKQTNPHAQLFLERNPGWHKVQ